MQYDFIIVGSGLFGAVFAQQAREHGRRVMIIERRDHIAGNCYTEKFQDSGINVHRYGTHAFHTNDERIWKYVNRFSEFNSYHHRVQATFRNRVYSLPINLGTINAFYGLNLKPGEVDEFLTKRRENIARPMNLEQKAISLIGRDLYHAFIKGYTIKQWGCSPTELPPSIITRLPVRNSYNSDYFDDRYQGIPVNGYTPLFERMLEGIPVELNVDFFDDREYWLKSCRQLVYSGPLDRFFDYRFGRLNWRSVRFEVESLPVADFQGTAQMNFPDLNVPYTRIHEYKHLHPEQRQRRDVTVIAREFSQVDQEAPYYPVNSTADQAMLTRYRALESHEPNVIFGGRLAEYKYYDMHQVIGSALQKAQQILQGSLRAAA